MKISLEARFILLLLYIAFLHAGAIFFFTRGFLLTRTELSHFSHCDDVQSAPCHGFLPFISDVPSTQDSMEGENSTSSKCWTEPAVKRVIIIIIDALRFDFVERSNKSDTGTMSWMNKLKILQELVEKESPSATYFKFISDPPTTTLQRLKGLTTGGLPTFIDIGHSFGAPAIVEDNLILQLKRMGKRVVMMGDDTWLQLFPDDLAEVYPFPSFNVKDLHTVDNGVIKELFPALHRDNWDVLIAHFLGVDHVGHIFGVESPLMVEKLEQYNMVIEKVVSVLRDLSEPGGPHEDTLLIIMGDHGQTLNGDHGGGTAEEVETALFALSMRKIGGFVPQNLRSSPCDLLSVDIVDHCISTLPQLDFAPTLAALLGIPFPFGSVGRVNPELYALSAGIGPNFDHIPHEHEKHMVLIEWLERYVKVLCLNSWQVKRYFEVYEASALSKFPAEELSDLNELYLKSQLLSDNLKEYQGLKLVAARSEEYLHKRILTLMDVILSFSSFLKAAGLLARSQWTQFGDGYMIAGILTLIISVAVHGFALLQLSKVGNKFKEAQAVQLLPIKRLLVTCIGSALAVIIVVVAFRSPPKLLQTYPFARLIASLKNEMHLTVLGVLLYSSSFSYLSTSQQGHKRDGGQHMVFHWLLKSKVADLKNFAALLFVAVHAFSLLSNSFILSEGQVATFLLASLGILYLRHAIQERSKVLQAILFLCLNRGLSSMGLTGIVKDGTMQVPVAKGVSDVPGLYGSWDRLISLLSVLGQTFLPLMFLSWMLIQHALRKRDAKYGILLMPSVAVPAVYLLVVVHWLVLDHATTLFVDTAGPMYEFARLYLPRVVYMTSIVSTLVTRIVAWRITKQNAKVFKEEIVKEMAIALLAALSPTIILLMGRKGPLIALMTFFVVRCLQDLQSFKQQQQELVMEKNANEMYSVPVVDWNFLAILLFFCTSHRCTFDGLRYPAAFIGFDDFNFFRQGTLLAIDTFGVSHLLPILGLPLIIKITYTKFDFSQQTAFTLQIGKAFLSFGMMRAITATFATICAALQRRHLMVWGLFAPKYVFDALGLLVTDFLLVIAAILYFYPR